MRPTAALVAILCLVTLGCAPDGMDTGAAGDVEVRPIEDVLDSAIVVTPDASGTGATVSVTTTVPLACAVIYGPDGEFGSIATDADMDGGAHRDHAPRLLGLEPATEYRYVLQGSDAQGRLYRSEELRFSTPEAGHGTARPGANVAPQGRVVDVSSEFSEAFAATNAIDGDPSSAWSSAGDGDGASITIELAEPTEVTGVALWSRSMGDGSSVIETYQVSVDGGGTHGPFEASTDELITADLDVTAQRLTFDAVSTTGGNTGAVEIEIYEAG